MDTAQACYAVSTACLAGHALADLSQDGVVLDVVGVVGLDLDGDAAQGALQGVLGRGVHHLGLQDESVWTRSEGGPAIQTHLNSGIIRRPGDEGQLVSALSLAAVSRGFLLWGRGGVWLARTGHPHQTTGCTRSRRQRIGGRCPLGPIIESYRLVTRALRSQGTAGIVRSWRQSWR